MDFVVSFIPIEVVLACDLNFKSSFSEPELVRGGVPSLHYVASI